MTSMLQDTGSGPYPTGLTPPLTSFPQSRALKRCLGITTGIALGCDALPDHFFLAVIHEHPLGYFGHSAAAAAADIVKGGRTDSDAGSIRSFGYFLHY